MNNRIWKAISNHHLVSCRKAMIKECYHTIQGEVTDTQKMYLESK